MTIDLPIGDFAGMLTGVGVLVTFLILQYKKGRQDGALAATVNGIKEIVPQMLKVQKDLATACQQITEHGCELQRGTQKFDSIQKDLSSIKDRVTWLEAKVNGKKT